MKLRKQRRRTIRAMLWRQPVWIAWSEVGIAGEPTGNGGFKFNIPNPRTEYMIQIRHTFDETGDRAVAQLVAM